MDWSVRILERIPSQVDRTVKYVFELISSGLIAEAAYIDKDDGKDIICVSTQTGCNLGCRFCHTTDAVGKIRTIPLLGHEIAQMVYVIRQDRRLGDKILLVSFMGCGEPLCSVIDVTTAIEHIHNKIPNSRFAIATLLPKHLWTNFFSLTERVHDRNWPVKIHLSLHFCNDEQRSEWMPAALAIEPSITALEFYKKLTGQSVEIHYALIESENDRPADALKLARLLEGRDISVKILKYNERPTINAKPSGNAQLFMAILAESDIVCEYYEPPGADVGASCGAFLLDHYLKHNGGN